MSAAPEPRLSRARRFSSLNLRRRALILGARTCLRGCSKLSHRRAPARAINIDIISLGICLCWAVQLPLALVGSDFRFRVRNSNPLHLFLFFFSMGKRKNSTIAKGAAAAVRAMRRWSNRNSSAYSQYRKYVCLALRFSRAWDRAAFASGSSYCEFEYEY